MGLINLVLREDEVYEAAKKTARKLARKPRKALLMTKKLMRRDKETLSERIDTESDQFIKFLQSSESKNILNKL